MTRYLSSALGAPQPLFGQSIMELERASGRPSADIRLSSEIMQKVRLKVAQLGLDPQDTTGPELYNALQEKLRSDEVTVRDALHIAADALPQDVLAAVQTFLDGHLTAQSAFALKSTTARRLLRKKPPKNTMKRLGYRSLDSMLKHESVAAVYAAALISESFTWQRSFREQYAKLQASDFEQRKINVLYPKANRWATLSEDYVRTSKHNILCFRELGVVVVLPLADHIEGLTITTLLLILHHLNDIRAYSSFAKLQQVKSSFGKTIQQSAATEPMTSARLAGQPVPWKVIQRYYGRMKQAAHLEVFEPHVQAEDLQWHDAETVLAELQPELSFWQDTQYVCMLHDDQPVSLNILDVALGYCNRLPFADRIVHFARQHLWYELMSRYLHQENLEAAVHQQLSKELVDDTALAES